MYSLYRFGCQIKPKSLYASAGYESFANKEVVQGLEAADADWLADPEVALNGG